MNLRSILPILALAGCSTSESNLGLTSSLPPGDGFGAARWALTFGGFRADRAQAAAFTPDGDLVAGGVFFSSVDFGSGPVGVDAQGNGFLSKRAGSDGAELWTVPLVGGWASVNGVAVARDGDVVATGRVQGEPVDFGGQALEVQQGGAFVARYDRDGHLVWVRGLDGLNSSEGWAVAVGDDGSAYVTGLFQGTIELPTGALEDAAATVTTAFLVAYDVDGSPRWGTTLGSWPAGVAVAPDGDVVVNGVIEAPTTIAGNALEPLGEQNHFLARFGAGGEPRWSRVVASGEYSPEGYEASAAGGLAVRPDDVIVAGAHEGFDMSDLDSVLRFLGPDGEPITAARPLSGEGGTTGSMAVRPGGSVIAMGGVSSPEADLGTGPLPYGLVALAYAADGTPAEALSFPLSPADDDPVLRIASGVGGELALAGTIWSSVDLGTGPLPTAGDMDIAIVVFDPPALP